MTKKQKYVVVVVCLLVVLFQGIAAATEYAWNDSIHLFENNYGMGTPWTFRDF